MTTYDSNGNIIFAGHSSWGKTRAPKNIAGAPGTAVALMASTGPLRASVAGYKTKGYATENQRYLHVLFTDLDTNPPAVTSVMGYCHAFERWFQIPESSSEGLGDNAAPNPAAVTAVDSTRAPAAQVPADTEYRLYEIAGIDRVAFVNADATETAVFAACSTF